MVQRGKKYRKVVEHLASDKAFVLNEALEFLKKNSFARFDETAEMAFRLGVNPPNPIKQYVEVSRCRTEPVKTLK